MPKKSTFRGSAVLSALSEAGDGFVATRRFAFVFKHSQDYYDYLGVRVLQVENIKIFFNDWVY
jgi:hypothetical protein